MCGGNLTSNVCADWEVCVRWLEVEAEEAQGRGLDSCPDKKWMTLSLTQFMISSSSLWNLFDLLLLKIATKMLSLPLSKWWETISRRCMWPERICCVDKNVFVAKSCDYFSSFRGRRVLLNISGKALRRIRVIVTPFQCPEICPVQQPTFLAGKQLSELMPTGAHKSYMQCIPSQASQWSTHFQQTLQQILQNR